MGVEIQKILTHVKSYDNITTYVIICIGPQGISNIVYKPHIAATLNKRTELFSIDLIAYY